jgi:hypothetical protein
MRDSNGLGCVGLERVGFKNSRVYETSKGGIGVASAGEDGGQCSGRERYAKKSSAADVTNTDASRNIFHIKSRTCVRSGIV